MTTIKISHQIKQLLDVYRDERPVTVAIDRLLEETGARKTEEFVDGDININIRDESLEELRQYKAYPTEPFNSVLYRLLVDVLDE